MASSLLNGERAVVALFISRTLYTTPLDLLSEGLFLSLLSLFALFLEIFAESSSSFSQFKTRPGASSGILLGAITLPNVMISRLIQRSRAVSLNDIDVGDLEHLRIQYWTVTACCFSMLLFIAFSLRKVPQNQHSISSRGVWGVQFGLSWLSLYAATYCVFFAVKLHNDSAVCSELLWVLFQGLAAQKLLQHVLSTFPFCASIGEALLVSAGITIYSGDMVALTLAKINVPHLSTGFVFVGNGILRSEISIIIQGILLGLLLFPAFFKLLIKVWYQFRSLENPDERACHEIEKSAIFFTSLAFILIVIVPSWMQIVKDFDVHPFLWVIGFIFSEPHKILPLFMYWVAVTCISVVRFYKISKKGTTERILLRKYYHLMAVAMFLPALIFQPKFLDLAFGAALALFLLLEIIRVWRIWPLGQLVHQFMNAFTDHRDSDVLIISHFSLLLGCALPIWMSSGFNDRPLAPFAGILSLGIGDTMASMIGYKYGVLRWSKTGKKTIEGTAAGITSVLAACSVLIPLLATTGYIFTQQWCSLILAVIISGLLEAYTAQLDNAFIPLVFYSLLCL
ncbi:dolichol kinase EVAN-like [Impatiens glandulifera]|uniref:dolichol kinase EVAN-like n=1 Tax=Impatiens glandulifera TaxID=253017 RepID=UPI001FB0723C|nr:dolichol kinase EVAN-like [Impatiens glandulifera]